MELNDVIEKRKAYRAFEPIEITDEFIQDIAYKASRAASCANKQPWRFIFVRDEAALTELHEALGGGNYWAKKASMIVAVFSKSDLDCIIGEREYYLFGTGMATAHLMLAVVDNGLVAHAMAGYDEDLAKKALSTIHENGLSNRVTIVNGDMFCVNITSADVVFLYLTTSANEKIRPKLESDLRKGVRVVSHDYEIVGWRPIRVENYCENPKLGYPSHTIYLYEKP